MFILAVTTVLTCHHLQGGGAREELQEPDEGGAGESFPGDKRNKFVYFLLLYLSSGIFAIFFIIYCEGLLYVSKNKEYFESFAKYR